MVDRSAIPSGPSDQRYSAGVTRSAADIASDIRRRMPGIGVKKLHKLLYYCQAHHLAAFGQPLYRESLSAWDMGPVVGRLWKAEKDGGEVAREGGELSESELNTVGYVLSRYGRLSGLDLEHMTHAEAPWRRADANRAPGGTTMIEREWIIDYFRDEDDVDDGPRPDPDLVRSFLRGAGDRWAQRSRRHG